MAYTEPTTRTTGTLISADMWNTDMVDNIVYLSKIPEPRLTNKSGSTRNVGDVVIADSANDNAYTTTTSQDNEAVLGVVMASTAANAAGRVATGGVVTVNVTGNVARGDYLRTSTSAGLANSAGVAKTPGSFARALTAFTGTTGTVTAIILVSVTGLDTFDGLAYQGNNLVKNFPSVESADAAQPEWWEVQNANITLTEEDATGESIPDKYERVLKCVNGGSGGGVYFYQRWTYADESILDPSNTIVSAGVWVYTAAAGTITLDLQDSAGGSLGTATTVVTSAWTWLEVKNKTLGAGTYLDLRLKHSANSATFYATMPMLNVGAKVRPWRPRLLRMRQLSNILATSTKPGTGATDLDLSSVSSNNAVFFELVPNFLRNAGVVQNLYIRPNGTSWSTAYAFVAASANTTPSPIPVILRGDDLRIIEYWVDVSEALATLSLYCKAFWEWE